jgi:hypothetical protein
MGKVIRRGVFETNSSSSHSISIAPGDFRPEHLPVDLDGVCRIHPGEFGWGVETFRDAASKASYCLVYCKDVARNVGEHVTHTPSDSPRLQAMLRDVIARETGATVAFVPRGNTEHEEMLDQDLELAAVVDGLAGVEHDWGYIDHQSDDICSEAFESQDTLRAFIFNPQSILRIDNDNH